MITTSDTVLLLGGFALSLIAARLLFVGTFFIEFDGRQYNVWRRGFVNSKFYGRSRTLEWAETIAKDGKRSPPRKYWLV